MNQAILFSDREWWDDGQQAVCFPALYNGFQMTCAIKGETVASRYGGDSSQEWLTLFCTHRWDLEDEAEVLIKDWQEDCQGWVWLS